ncbi:MAG TPA: hypothetical protein DCR87_08945 [Acidobacteria bacterium]|nr:hypothetical protein [Acidobacteriota bacterium]
MKKRKFKIFIFVLILMLVFSLNFVRAFSSSKQQQPPPPGQVEIRTVEPFVYCCLSREGSFSELEAVLGELMQNMQIQNILPAGPMIGIYYGDPELTDPEKMRWEIGFPISEQVQVLAPLEKKVWSFTTVAVSVHQGPYDKAGETILKMQEWLEANGYAQSGPILERYLDPDPSRVSASGLKTEIWIACRKR